jgi:hypothetical protein
MFSEVLVDLLFLTGAILDEVGVGGWVLKDGEEVELELPKVGMQATTRGLQAVSATHREGGQFPTAYPEI